MTLTVKRAVKEQSKIRLALAGPAGAGKTWTSLVFAQVLAQGGKIIVIDSEHGRSQKYADVFAFDIIELDTFSPKVYIEALALAHKEGAAVVIIDSLSHAWNGEGGILEQVRGNFNNWKEATPLQNRLINTIQRTPFHTIVTMRSKTEYVVESINGKASPKEVGTEAIQRDGVDYEFDIFGMMDREHTLQIRKSVCRGVPVGKYYSEPDESIATTLLEWLNDGKKAVEKPEEESPQEEPQTPKQRLASTRTTLEQQTQGTAWQAAHPEAPAEKKPTKAELEVAIKAEREKFGLIEEIITRHLQSKNWYPTVDGLGKLLADLRKPKTILMLFCKQHDINSESYKRYCLDNETNGDGVYAAIQDDDRRQDIIDALKSYQPQEVTA